MSKKSTQPHTHTQNPQAVIYARVSSKEQEKEGYSIPAQLKLGSISTPSPRNSS